MSVLTWFVVFSCAVAIAFNGWYVVKFNNGPKRNIRVLNCILLFGFGMIFVLLGVNYYGAPTPPVFVIRPAVILLVLMLAAESLYDLCRR